MLDTSNTISDQCDVALTAWLAARDNHTTASVYRRVLMSFRAELRSQRLDLDSDPPMVAQAAQHWASQGERSSKTYRWRLDILSSFYRYARRAGLLSGENPIDLIARLPLATNAGPQPLEHAKMRRRTVSGRRSLSKQRDQALLSVGQITGRRSTELAGLRWRDVKIEGEEISLAFCTGKRGTLHREMLPLDVGRQLVSYFQALYGPALDRLPPDAPIWPSFARNQDQHQALSSQAIAKIIRTHLKCS
jgi:site-specific recombinase XerD